MALFSQLFPSFLVAIQGGRGLSPRSGEQTGEDSAAGGAGAPRQAGHCKARSSAVALAASWIKAFSYWKLKWYRWYILTIYLI